VSVLGFRLVLGSWLWLWQLVSVRVKVRVRVRVKVKVRVIVRVRVRVRVGVRVRVRVRVRARICPKYYGNLYTKNQTTLLSLQPSTSSTMRHKYMRCWGMWRWGMGGLG
jgi:hypothetical protein